MGERRRYTMADFDMAAARHRRWGVWGADDELGATNFVDEDAVVRAAALVRRGAVFSLAIDLGRGGPQLGTMSPRTNPQHVMIRDGGDMLVDPDTAGRGLYSTDDVVIMPLQAGTQWDAFGHVFYDSQSYNGRGPNTVSSSGARHNSITALREKMTGRGVLLDLPRWHGVEYLEPGHAIQDDDLVGCAEAQGVEVGRGDFVLIRTGHLDRCRAHGWLDYVGGASPGLGMSTIDFFGPREVAAVASDTSALEVSPSEIPGGVSHPAHVLLLVEAGIVIGEIWDLDALAEDCARDGVYEFLLVAAPLPITGAVGSPINPIAIK